MLAPAGSDCFVGNITIDGAALTSSRGITGIAGSTFYRVFAKNCTNNGLRSAVNTCLFLACSATGCSTQTAASLAVAIGCEIYSNTITGLTLVSFGIADRCLIYANSGASSDGVSLPDHSIIMNSVIYNNGRDGVRAAGLNTIIVNTIVEGNAAGGAIGINIGANFYMRLINCAVYNNTTNTATATTPPTSQVVNLITGSSTFFTNAGSGDFSLNANSTGGALARSAGILGLFPAATSRGYLDIGAVQHADSGGEGIMNVLIKMGNVNISYS